MSASDLSSRYPCWHLLLPETRRILGELEGWSRMASTSRAKPRDWQTPRPCAYKPCGVVFVPTRPHQRFHIPACQEAHHKATRPERDMERYVRRKRIRALDTRKLGAVTLDAQMEG